MSLARDVGFLRQVPVFADLDEDQLKLIAFNAERRQAGEGQFLFRQGDLAQHALIIVSGRVEALRETDTQILREGVHGAGTVFGELAMVISTERPISARALEPVEALAVPRHVFHRVLEEYPEIAARLHAGMAERVQALLGDLRGVAPRFAGEE